MITRVSFFVCLMCVALVNAKSNRIIGGDMANPGQFKYQVSLQFNHKHHCGAAIIADQYVLTAAHCVVEESGKFSERKFQVVVGSTNLATNPGTRIDVETVYVPKRYSPVERRNDIAVLKLVKGLGLGSKPNLEKLNLPPRTESFYDGRLAIMSGYGFTEVELKANPTTGLMEEVNGSTDGKLKYVMINIIGHRECDSKNFYQKVDENQICGQAVQRGKKLEAICTGDSGGPLVRGNTIIGVASSSPLGCKEDQFATVYTKVSSFITFIEKSMKYDNTKCPSAHEIHIGESSSSSKQTRSKKETRLRPHMGVWL